MSAVETPNIPLDMQGAYIPPQRVTIFSVYPQEMEVKFSRRAPVNTFKIAAGSRENPTLLVVEDTWESNATGTGNTRILAEHTANDIVEQMTTRLWEADGPTRSYPGIAVCAGNYPTPAEIDDAEACKRRFFALLVNAAREFERLDRRKDVQPRHRMAGRELGIKGEKWMLDDSKETQKKCSWCSDWIDATARRCPKCTAFQTPQDAADWAKMNAPAVPVVPLQPTVAHNHKDAGRPA